MTLRTKFIVYLVVLHGMLGVAAAVFLLQQTKLLFVVEALFVVSIVAGWRLIHALFLPLEVIRTGAELIGERDFTSRFVGVGQPEMDALVDVYNRMADRLREERIAAEERHQFLQKLVEASPAGIVICDFDGKVEQMNPAARRLLEGTNLAALSEGLLTLNGNRRVKVWRAEFRDRGFVKSFFLIEELTEDLRRSERSAYEKMIRMMSHEVNNSVGAVRSLLESSLRYSPQIGDADRNDFIHALTIASARIDALNQFMRGFADVIRIPPPRLTPTLVRDVIDRIVGVLQVELDRREIAVRVDVGEKISADIDQYQFEQVIVNILRNAIESIDRKGTIEIAMLDGVLTIADSGPGIPDDLVSDLFTPYFSTKRDGRGLGLALVQEILTNHGLAFWLQNRTTGGAEFGIRLGERASRPHA